MLARQATSSQNAETSDNEAAIEKYLRSVLAVENILTLDRLRQVDTHTHSVTNTDTHAHSVIHTHTHSVTNTDTHAHSVIHTHTHNVAHSVTHTFSTYSHCLSSIARKIRQTQNI